MKQRLQPQTKKSFITYGIMLAAFAAAEIMLATGHMTSMFKGLLVPLWVYSTLRSSPWGSWTPQPMRLIIPAIIHIKYFFIVVMLISL